MPRALKLCFAVCGLLIGVMVLVVIAGPSVQRSVFYPKPKSLPPVVSETTKQLLVRLESVLETKAPLVARSLKPGLSDSEIAAYEAKGNFRLSEDLNTLYRWRNGMSPTNVIGLLPARWFLPLGDVVEEAMVMQKQSGVMFQVFAGHRRTWLHIMDDGAGDGVFWNPARKDEDGAFFDYFSEGSEYIWFPSVRNYLAGVIECYDSGVVKIAAGGEKLEQDFEGTEKIWSRLGKSSESSLE